MTQRQEKLLTEKLIRPMVRKMLKEETLYRNEIYQLVQHCEKIVTFGDHYLGGSKDADPQDLIDIKKHLLEILKISKKIR